MKMYYRNSSSSFTNVLLIPSNNKGEELERVLTKRESKEFPSLIRVQIKKRRNDIDKRIENMDSIESIENTENGTECSKMTLNDRIKYKTVWMGPGGGYSVMEEYAEPRKCLEKEIPMESEMEFRRYRRPGECKNVKSMSNIKGSSSVTILENADTLKEDSYIYRTSKSLVSIENKRSEKTILVGPLPYQNKVAIGNRSRLGRDLVPLN
ncbi:hypothetical protein FG386_003273 [Cryptosporidium ryanae]|uniref:uncharacterized protein n=1 Tax=Cryptosporidium ryanae TaxID=515981 RepID=UPI00351A1885|nr:hypothetical protein FG386_003273 [Cryptosporidium ryanae]